MALEGLSFVYLMGLSLILSMAILASHGLPTPNENDGEIKLKCNEDSKKSIVDGEHCRQQFYVNPRENFSYFQISMKIESCYPKDIYRGNRYYGKDILQTAEARLEGFPVSLSGTVINGTHAYIITIKQRHRTLTDVIDTATPCGKCHGFKMKAIGATVCTEDQPNALGNMAEKVPRRTRHVAATFEAPESDTVEEIRRWSILAYFMAACLSMGLYVTILTVKSCQRMVDAFRMSKEPAVM